MVNLHYSGMNEFTLPSFAKINLILRILGLRPDGYHSIYTVFQTVDLHDQITFRFEPSSELSLQLQVDHPDVPRDQTNLIARAFNELNRRSPLKARISIRVQKRIPTQSGLGGGSSNAAVALIAGNRFLGWLHPREVLAQIAAGLGADVPFFLFGGTAIGRNKGDDITQIEDAPGCPVLLVHPDVSCSTPAVYKKYDEAESLTGSGNSIKILSDQQPEFQRGVVPSIENDLEKVVFALYPELDSIKQKLVGLGALSAGLSGSGSTVVGFFGGMKELESAAPQFPVTTQSRFVSRSEYEKRLVLPENW